MDCNGLLKLLAIKSGLGQYDFQVSQVPRLYIFGCLLNSLYLVLGRTTTLQLRCASRSRQLTHNIIVVLHKCGHDLWRVVTSFFPLVRECPTKRLSALLFLLEVSFLPKSFQCDCPHFFVTSVLDDAHILQLFELWFLLPSLELRPAFCLAWILRTDSPAWILLRACTQLDTADN